MGIIGDLMEFLGVTNTAENKGILGLSLGDSVIKCGDQIWREIEVGTEGVKENLPLIFGISYDQTTMTWGGLKGRETKYVITDKQTFDLANEENKKDASHFRCSEFSVVCIVDYNAIRKELKYYVFPSNLEKASEESDLKRMIFKMDESKGSILFKEIAKKIDRIMKPEYYPS